MLKEQYKLGKTIIEPEDVIFHDFSTRVEINGVSYQVMKWTSDYEIMTRTIELRPISKPKKA